jgi:hypothetical protein
MILRILLWLVGLIVVLFIGYWVFTGGLSRGFNFAGGIGNPFDAFISGSATGTTLRLPGQPDELLPGIDLATYMDGSGNSPSGESSYEQLSELQQQYDELYAKAKDPKNFGSPSPYRGLISFGTYAAQASDPASEYIVLYADQRNTSPISLAGWSLQSAVTGARLAIPPAASVFVSGVLNSAAAVSLDPGASAIVTSGISPVGASFRENRCTGYLGEMQNFTPELNRTCPTAETELPITAQNIQLYGDACIDYVKNIPQCHYPGTDPAIAMPQACKDFLLNRLTYNGCQEAHRGQPGFFSGSWRLYLSASTQLWRDTHDVIRLLDDQGRTVDVLTY